MKPLHAHYHLHQTVLAPVLSGGMDENWTVPCEYDSSMFVRFLVQQHLHGVWSKILNANMISPDLLDMEQTLNELCKQSAAAELLHKRAMQEVHEALTDAGIPYFFAKGAHLRYTLYDQEWHRPAQDIDVFVRPQDRHDAINACQSHGFEAQPLAENLTHEIKLIKYHTSVDLHWHLMRPSRFYHPLDSWLFEHRESFGSYWGLDPTASLLVMLAHPPITKYLISPTSMLIHLVDQHRLITSKTIDWEGLEKALHSSGLKTAAWSSLYLLNLISGINVCERLEHAIRPGKIKSYYLRQWIDRAWISRFFEHRWLVAPGFNLALQDSLYGTLRAVSLTVFSRLLPAALSPEFSK